MADSGIAVCSYDAFGHGRSEGERAYVDTFSSLVDDFERFSAGVREEAAARGGAEGKEGCDGC
jgi:alpha-beta hydrolase superfamily lysophospholipase